MIIVVTVAGTKAKRVQKHYSKLMVMCITLGNNQKGADVRFDDVLPYFVVFCCYKHMLQVW